MAVPRAETSHTAATLPGPLYPDRCLECPALLHEDYGSRGGRCADCVRADLGARAAETAGTT